MPLTFSEIVVDEKGDEKHESWLLIRANKVSSSGTYLFDSEIKHRHFVTVTVTRCRRRRDLKRDWLSSREILLEMSMSQAQWGAFVSSFGDGSGVPATLTFLTGVGHVPQAPFESRLAESHAEVRTTADEAIKEVQEAFEAYEAHKTVGNRNTLKYAIQNLPANMEFAAKSLTEHTENVVTKARADIEGMVLEAIERGELPEGSEPLQIGGGS